MEELMKLLTPAQQYWFANLLIHAIWADGKIVLSEFESLQRLIGLFKSLENRTQLMRHLENNQGEPIVLPPDLDRKLLPQVYLEVLNFSISDWDLAEEERNFLETLSNQFGFAKSFQYTLMQWAEEGLRWQEDQRLLVPREVTLKNPRVPLHQMTDQQKVWYAEVLVSVVMIDGIVDPMEIKLLRTALSFVAEEKEKKRLLAFIKNRMRPSLLSPPPGLEMEVIYLIFFEVLRVMSLNDELANKEMIFIGDYIKACNLPASLEDRTLVWCKRGTTWRQKRKSLAKLGAFVDLGSGSSLEKSEDRWLPHGENNSLQYREQTCYLCDNNLPIKVYRLRPKSQKPATNLFGLPVYVGAMTAQDHPLDFNKVKISVCPNCLFASPAKESFRAKEVDKVPPVFEDRDFLVQWMEGTEKRKASYGMLLQELESVNPSVPHVEKLYRLAIHCLNQLQKARPDDRQRWGIIFLGLGLAEILVNAGHVGEAEKELLEAERLSKELMLSTRDNELSLRSAKLLFQLALYQNNAKSASNYLNFFVRLKDEKMASMKPAEKSQFLGYFNEVKRDFEDREELQKSKLDGFKRKVEVPTAAQPEKEEEA